MSREWHLKRDRKFRKKLAQKLKGERAAMSIFKEPKIDCHVHVLDPVDFPYGKDIEYKPSGPEIGTPPQLRQVMKTYGVSHALLVQPNSGYGSDNSCMLDTIARGDGRFKGIAIIDFDADLAALRDLKAQGSCRRGLQPDLPRHRLLQAIRRADRQARRARHVPANPESSTTSSRCSCPGSRPCRSAC